MAPWRAAGCAALVVACARGEDGAADVLVPSTLSILFAAPFLDYSLNMHEVQSGFLWALEEVNNSTEVLPSTVLTSSSFMTRCTMLSGADVGNAWVNATADEELGGIVGGSCSDSSIGLSFPSYRKNVAQVSYGSTVADLSDKSKYPLFNRAMAPDDVMISAVVDFMAEHAYENAGCLTNQDSTFLYSLLDALNRIASHTLDMSILTAGDDGSDLITAWEDRVVGTDFGSNLRVWILWQSGGAITSFFDYLDANYTEVASNSLFICPDTLDNRFLEVPPRMDVVYFRPKAVNTDAFEAKWQADLPAHLRENSPLRYAVGNGSTAASRETFYLHSYVAYAYDATWALARRRSGEGG